MIGQHHVLIESARLKYEFVIRRNITVIRGDSGTGKTTLVELIRDAGNNRQLQPVRIESDLPCLVYSGSEDDWKLFLSNKSPSIIFIDESSHFIVTKEFAEWIQHSPHAYVLITRDPLYCLPYSIMEIYGIRTSGKYHFPQQIYHEFYPLFQDSFIDYDSPEDTIILDEDAKSGFLFLKACCNDSPHVLSAQGNANIYQAIKNIPADKSLVVIADGAAFGAFISRVMSLAALRKKTTLYFPESFEWMILKSGVVKSSSLNDILNNPEEFIDSSVYFSWEQFFTSYLETITQNDPRSRYQKSSLPRFYTEGLNREQILRVFPDLIQACIRNLAEHHEEAFRR